MKRDSRFETLRLIAIVSIVLSHFVGHTVGNALSADAVSLNRVLGLFMLSGGKLGVNLFLLISGYFQSRRDFHLEKVARLECQVLFYSLLALLVNAVLFLRGKAELPGMKILEGIFPTVFGAYYYVTPFMGVLILSPFLNGVLNHQKTSGTAVLLLGLLVCVIPTFTLQKGWASTFTMFFFVYLAGGWIARNEAKFHLSAFQWMLVFIGLEVLTVILGLAVTFAGRFVPRLATMGTHFANSENSLTMFLAAAALMMAFLQRPAFVSERINRLAGHAFSVYLIQSSKIVANNLLWPNLKTIVPYSSAYWPLFALGVGFLITAVCMIIDIPRELLFRKISMRRFEKIFSAADEKMRREEA